MNSTSYTQFVWLVFVARLLNLHITYSRLWRNYQQLIGRFHLICTCPDYRESDKHNFGFILTTNFFFFPAWGSKSFHYNLRLQTQNVASRHEVQLRTPECCCSVIKWLHGPHKVDHFPVYQQEVFPEKPPMSQLSAVSGNHKAKQQMFPIKPQLLMTQHSGFLRERDLFQTNRVKTELTTEQQPPDNDSAFMIIYRSLSRLQTSGSWDRLTPSQTSRFDSCIWQFLSLQGRAVWKPTLLLPFVRFMALLQRCWTELGEVVGRSQEASDCSLFTLL